jgi:hypothetical protein
MRCPQWMPASSLSELDKGSPPRSRSANGLNGGYRPGRRKLGWTTAYSTNVTAVRTHLHMTPTEPPRAVRVITRCGSTAGKGPGQTQRLSHLSRANVDRLLEARNCSTGCWFTMNVTPAVRTRCANSGTTPQPPIRQALLTVNIGLHLRCSHASPRRP